MKKRLNKISEIQFGVHSRTVEKGNIPYLQISNLEDGRINSSTLVYAENQNSLGNLLKNNDLLIAAKGDKTKAALVPEELTNAVASSSLFIIRVKNKQVLPEYLQWYLNLPRTQWALKKESTGSNIVSLSIKNLRKLEVEIPDFSTQKKVAELKKLQEREADILSKLSLMRKQLIEAVTKNLIH